MPSQPPSTMYDSSETRRVAIPPQTGIQGLWAQVIRHARCADADLDPDHWFPVSAEADQARHEAAAAIAICMTCPVRSQCLALSLWQWEIGQHGVWGGLVAAERAALGRRTHPIMTRKAVLDSSLRAQLQAWPHTAHQAADHGESGRST